MQDLLTLMHRQAVRDARGDSNGDRTVTRKDMVKGEGNATRAPHKTKLAWPVNANNGAKPATGLKDAPRRDSVELELGLAKGELTSHGRNVSVGVTSTRLYALRGPIQFRPYVLPRKGYATALQIKVDAGMLVIVGKAKTKTVPAHWRVELHCGKDVTVLHNGFNAHGHPANKDAAIGNAYKFLVK